ALASTLAGRIYGVRALLGDVEDDPNNTTRFLLLSREARAFALGGGPFVASVLFRVRDGAAALFKAPTGLAAHSVHIMRLGRDQLEGRFTATQFYADVEGHPDDPPLARALEELGFFSAHLRIVGTYPQAAYRRERTADQ